MASIYWCNVKCIENCHVPSDTLFRSMSPCFEHTFLSWCSFILFILFSFRLRSIFALLKRISALKVTIWLECVRKFLCWKKNWHEYLPLRQQFLLICPMNWRKQHKLFDGSGSAKSLQWIAILFNRPHRNRNFLHSNNSITHHPSLMNTNCFNKQQWHVF